MIALRVQLLALWLVGGVLADVYLQNPRGSNNRQDEKTADRTNNNRLFDSQNNNRGGYNTGDRLDKDFGNSVERQYAMQYYGSGPASSEDTKLLVEWTNQHGCGGNSKMLCNIVIQYMCMNNGTDEDYPEGHSRAEEEVEERRMYLRDGTKTDTNEYKSVRTRGESDDRYLDRMEENYEENVDDDYGLHETVWWYDTCRYREANGGLFTADQDLENDNLGYPSASRTRQNNDGDRSGYECPEERDYFPYWAPTLQTENLNERFQRTPWIDLAWLGDESKCDYIKGNSFNQNSKFRCVLPEARKYGKSITEEDCTGEEGGSWVEFQSFLEVLTDITSNSACQAANRADDRNKISWKKLRSDDDAYACIVQAPELECGEAPWSRVNHLGNSENSGSGSKPNASRIEVDLPYFPSGIAKRCVMRLRYNISTADYDPWTTDSSSNNDDSVISNNPTVDVLGNGEELDIALNTAQTGRTFQDRTHVFVILPRLSTMEDKTIYNLNVRGKRGNIVQTFPATEYDFIPDRLKVGTDDLVHIQWTGSNSHDNNNEGDAGEGTGGSDRHNMLQMDDLDKSYPLTLENTDFWSNVESLTDPDASGIDIAIGLATSGYYCAQSETDGCPSEYTISGSRRSRGSVDGTLDNAPASYFGHVLKFNGPGTLYYMCSRNNNFSNRSQKGTLWVSNRAEEE